MFAMQDSNSGEYLIVYLADGQPSLLFDPVSIGLIPAVMLSASSSYSDGTIHQITVAFDDRTIQLVVDGTERVSSQCEQSTHVL